MVINIQLKTVKFYLIKRINSIQSSANPRERDIFKKSIFRAIVYISFLHFFIILINFSGIINFNFPKIFVWEIILSSFCLLIKLIPFLIYLYEERFPQSFDNEKKLSINFGVDISASIIGLVFHIVLSLITLSKYSLPISDLL